MLVVLALSVLFSSVSLVSGRFTQAVCAATSCIQQNSAGTWCYIPTAGVTRATTCTGTSADFANVMETHLAQGISVAYYNGAGDTQYPGGPDYPIPDNPGIIRLCMSGRSGDGNYQTACMNVAADNQIPTTGPGCTVVLGQNNVTDGCYDPNALPVGVTPPPTSSATGTGTGTVLTRVKTTTVSYAVTETVTRTSRSSSLYQSKFTAIATFLSLFVLYTTHS